MQSNAANVLNSENQESECVSSSLLNFANLPSSGNNIILTSTVFTVNENQRIIRENFHFFRSENIIVFWTLIVLCIMIPEARVTIPCLVSFHHFI